MDNPTKSNICIIKENDLYPKILFIDSILGDHVALKPVERQYNTPICIPQIFVFRYDEKLFQELNEAYIRGEKKLLEELWSKAKRWEPEDNSK